MKRKGHLLFLSQIVKQHNPIHFNVSSQQDILLGITGEPKIWLQRECHPQTQRRQIFGPAQMSSVGKKRSAPVEAIFPCLNCTSPRLNETWTRFLSTSECEGGWTLRTFGSYTPFFPNLHSDTTLTISPSHSKHLRAIYLSKAMNLLRKTCIVCIKTLQPMAQDETKVEFYKWMYYRNQVYYTHNQLYLQYIPKIFNCFQLFEFPAYCADSTRVSCRHCTAVPKP